MAMADEADRGTAFLFAPIAIGIGILVYFEAAAEPSLLVLAAATLIGATAALALRRLRFLSLPAAAVCLIGFGASLAHFETWRRAGAVLGSEVTTRITGRIEAVEQLASGRIRLTLRLLSSAHPALSHPPDRVRVSTRALPAAAEPGSVVGGLVHLRPPTGPVRPGSFDFAFDSFFEGLGATGFFLGPPQLEPEPETDAEQSWLWRLDAAAERVRDAMAGRIRARIGGVEGEIAAALVVGVRAGIPEDVNEALRRTGLAHVLSISGLHMALVAATVMGAIRFGLALLPGVAARWPVKKFAAGGALLALAVYLAVSGYAVAAERSFIMLAIMLVAVIFDRAALTLRNVALAALAVEAWTPHEVVGPSFQMSFAATVALVGAYGRVTRRTAHGGPTGAVRGLPARLLSATARHGIGLALTSLVAGAATAVYGIYHFGRVAPLSLPTNLVAMPVVSALAMPAAVVAVALMPLGWDGPALDAMGKGLAWMTGVAEWFSARSPLDRAGVAPVGAVLSITAALLFATLFSGRLRWLAVPLAAAGLAGFALRAAPDVLVAGVATGARRPRYCRPQPGP